MGLGATAGIAGGVLAIPGLVQFLLEQFAPDWLGPSHYDKTRMKSEAQGQGMLGAMNDLYDRVAKQGGGDPRLLQAALAAKGGDRGSLRSFFNTPEAAAAELGLQPGAINWSDMTPQQFDAVMQWIGQDPSRLSAVAGSGDLPYLETNRAQFYGGEAADYARNLIAQQTGLPYLFVEPEHRGVLRGMAQYNPQGYGSALDPKYIDIMSRKEKAYQDARNAWAAAHPGVELRAWSPRVMGREDALMQLFLDEQRSAQGSI